jgi:hypothetical protein
LHKRFAKCECIAEYRSRIKHFSVEQRPRAPWQNNQLLGNGKKATFFVVPVTLSANTEVLAMGYLPSPFLVFLFSVWQVEDLSILAGGGGLRPNPNKAKSVIFFTKYCSEEVQDRTGNMSSERRTEENPR